MSAPVAVVFPLAALVVLASLGGILFPSTYARETAEWTAQAVARDWFDLVIAVPCLVISATLALRGAARALPVLAGGVLYTLYEFFICAFSVHFNALFIVYCVALGGSCFASLGTILVMAQEPAIVSRWSGQPRRTVAAFLMALAVVFAGAWLGEIIPAMASGTDPKALVDAGLPANPVHVMGLSIVLPVHFTVGIALLRRARAGVVLAPVLLAFDAITAASIAGMMLGMHGRGIATSSAVTAAMIALSAVSATLLVHMLREPRST